MGEASECQVHNTVEKGVVTKVNINNNVEVNGVARRQKSVPWSSGGSDRSTT